MLATVSCVQGLPKNALGRDVAWYVSTTCQNLIDTKSASMTDH